VDPKGKPIDCAHILTKSKPMISRLQAPSVFIACEPRQHLWQSVVRKCGKKGGRKRREEREETRLARRPPY
jgi:hypothetical protein